MVHPLISLRKETDADRAGIDDVVEAAFARRSEADLVEALRLGGALTLSAVAVQGPRVVGHVAYSPAEVVSRNSVVPVLALGPMAVVPGCQRQGIGSALIRWSLEECRALGHGVVFVLGDPAYYSRFGFVAALGRGVHCPFPAPPEAFRLLELSPGALNGATGTFRYRPEFEAV